RVYHRVAGHAVPLERLRYQRLGRDLPEPAFEAGAATLVVLDHTPVATLLELEALDVERVAPAPPLLQELGLRVGAPHQVAGRLEDPLHLDGALVELLAGVLVRRSLGGHASSLRRSRSSPRWSKRSSRVRW